jgi:hypothetical protein
MNFTEKIYEIEEMNYKPNFIISDNYIKFSGELLRLSLLLVGGFGTITLIKIKGEDNLEIFLHPTLFILALICFVLCIGASLCHRYYETDTMSWYISFLRVRKINDTPNMKKEKLGFKKNT